MMSCLWERLIDPEALDVTLSLPRQAPKRRHKKKRIQKKWIKKYGYRTEWVNIRGHFVPNADGSYGFTGVRI